MITDLQTYARIGLEAELARLDGERERVRALLASLGGTTSKPLSARPAAKRGQMSEAGRQAIREAQKRRWARVRAEAGASASGTGDKAEGASAVSQKSRPRETRTGNRKK
jgi:hypothetical protein